MKISIWKGKNSINIRQIGRKFNQETRVQETPTSVPIVILYEIYYEYIMIMQILVILIGAYSSRYSKRLFQKFEYLL